MRRWTQDLKDEQELTRGHVKRLDASNPSRGTGLDIDTQAESEGVIRGSLDAKEGDMLGAVTKEGEGEAREGAGSATHSLSSLGKDWDLLPRARGSHGRILSKSARVLCAIYLFPRGHMTAACRLKPDRGTAVVSLQLATDHSGPGQGQQGLDCSHVPCCVSLFRPLV